MRCPDLEMLKSVVCMIQRSLLWLILHGLSIYVLMMIRRLAHHLIRVIHHWHLAIFVHHLLWVSSSCHLVIEVGLLLLLRKHL